MKRITIALSFLMLSLSILLAPGTSIAVEAGFKESLERLKLLYTPAAAPEGHTPVPAAVVIDSTEDGTLIVTRHSELDRSKFRFSSVSEQTWRVHPADLDAKRVAVQTEPMGVFVPVKKNVKRVMVERHEAKTRTDSANEPGEQWQESQKFTTSFVIIPAATPQQADEAAALIKQIIKSAPETKTK